MEEELEQEESSILSLTDENGVETNFEYLDSVDYEGDEYLVLLPADDPETSIVILKVIPIDEETENYVSVNDEKLMMTIYEIFKERYKDVLTFEE